MTRTTLTSVLWALAMAVLCSACASSARSVRAVRQYQKEPPRVLVALDRLEDMDACLGLVETILKQTPYTPGDAWVQQLALDETSAAVLEADLRRTGQMYSEAALRVPVAKLYRVHVEGALSRRPTASDPQATYPNVMAALADLVKGGEVGQRWAAMDDQIAQIGALGAEIKTVETARGGVSAKDQPARFEKLTAQLNALESRRDSLEDALEADKDAFVAAVSAVQTGAGELGVMIQDMLAVSSVVARLEVEAFAMAPIVGVALVRAAQDLRGAAPEASVGGAIDLIKLKDRLIDSPVLLASIAGRLQSQSALLVALAETLSTLAGVSVADSPGYAFAESASSQVVGFALDSFYVDMRVGADVLIFNNFDNEDGAEGGGEGAAQSFDLTGRQRKLQYTVEPIVLAAFKLDAGFDLGNIPNFFTLDLGYETDRVYRSGGTVEESSDVFKHLGVQSAVTDVISAGLALVGINTRVKVASFTAGEVQVLDANTDEILDAAPLQFKFTQIDLTYDLMWIIDSDELHAVLDTMPVGFRYLDYELPRIVYEYEDTNGDPDTDDFVYVAESDPQGVRSQYFMAGVEFQRGTRPSGDWRWIGSLGVFLGGGPSAFFPRADPDELRSKVGFAGVFTGALGFAWPFLSPENTLQIDLELLYEAQAILGTFVELQSGEAAADDSDLGDKSRNFGGFDLFHGPRLRFSMSF